MGSPFSLREGVKSTIGVPLIARNRKVGVLFVNYRSHHRFIEEELINVRLFAHQAAVAIRNAQLYEQERKRAIALEALYKAGKAVTSLLTLDEILDRIAEQAWRLVGQRAHYTSIRLVDNEIARLVAAFPPEELDHRRATFPEINLRIGVNGRFGVTGRAIKTGNPQLVDDVIDDADYLTSQPDARSELAVPIKLGERVIGVINAESLKLAAFDKDDELTLISLASFAAIAINNAQLHGETNKRAETLEGLYIASKAITGTLAIDETLTRIAEQALRIVGASPLEGCFSHVALREGTKLRFIATCPINMLDSLNQIEIDLETSPKVGVSGRTVLTGVSQNVPDVRVVSDYIPSKEDIYSQLSVPLTISERIIGVLSIEHPKSAAFNDDDVKKVESVAAHAAVAIENTRLFNVAEQRATNLDTILRLSQTIISSLDLEHILNSACQAAVALLKVDHGGLVLFDQDLITGKVCAEYPKIGAVGVTFPLHGVPAEEHLIASKEPLMVTDVVGEPGFDPVRDVLTKLDTRSILIVPIVSKGQILGSFGLDAMKHQRTFTEEEIELCKIFAAQVAVAIENARQYEELKQTQGLVGARTALAWMGMANSAWRHTIEGYAINIRNTATLMRQDIQKGDNDLEMQPQLEKRLELIEGEVAKILKKPITPPLSSEESTEVIFINDLIRERLSQLWEDDPYQSISPDLQLAGTANVKVKVSPEWFRRGFDILIDNAVEAMAHSPVRNLTVTTRLSGSQIEIAISDTGTGIPSELHEKIFKEPIEKPEGARGFGMGLLMVQAIMQAYKGDTRLESSGLHGTRFIVSLPVAK
jgi:GAF domain-containing protein